MQGYVSSIHPEAASSVRKKHIDIFKYFYIIDTVMTHDTTVTVLRALGDDVRLGMVRALLHERKAVSGCDIVSSCASFTKLSQPTMSHHFNKLVEGRVLIESKDGVAKSYQLNRTLLKSVGIDINKL